MPDPDFIAAYIKANRASVSFQMPDTIDLRWYQEQLARFTYKPGWSFRIEPTSFMAPTVAMIVAVMEVEDTYHPGTKVKVSGVRELVGIDNNPNAFAMTLASLIQEMEVHEAREWLKRDGEIYDNPHNPRPVTAPAWRWPY